MPCGVIRLLRCLGMITASQHNTITIKIKSVCSAHGNSPALHQVFDDCKRCGTCLQQVWMDKCHTGSYRLVRLLSKTYFFQRQTIGGTIVALLLQLSQHLPDQWSYSRPQRVLCLVNVTHWSTTPGSWSDFIRKLVGNANNMQNLKTLLTIQ